MTHSLSSLTPMRWNSYARALSVVMSVPETTPAFWSAFPVAYKSMFTVPERHCVTLTRIFPFEEASLTMSRNHSFERAFPEPYVSMITARVSEPQRMFRTTCGVIPGCIFSIETLVSRAVDTLRGESQESGLRMACRLY